MDAESIKAIGEYIIGPICAAISVAVFFWAITR